MLQANKGFSTDSRDAYVASLISAIGTSSLPSLIQLILDDLDLDICELAPK
jgi:hypothetical protein